MGFRVRHRILSLINAAKCPPQPVAYCFINAYEKVQKTQPERIPYRPSRDVQSLFMLVFGFVLFRLGSSCMIFPLWQCRGNELMLLGARCPEGSACGVSTQRTSPRAQSIISYLTLSCLLCRGKSRAWLVSVFLCQRQAWLLRVSLNKLHPSLCRRTRNRVITQSKHRSLFYYLHNQGHTNQLNYQSSRTFS